MYYRTNKYRNKRVTIGDKVYDSKKEGRRAYILKMLEKAGEISELKEQVAFELQPPFELNGKRYRAIKYIADFTYKDKDGNFVVEDIKSPATKTQVYEIKKKIMAYKYDIEIKEV